MTRVEVSTPAGPDDFAARFSYATIWWLAVGFLGVQLSLSAYNAFLPLLLNLDFFDSRAAIGLLMGTDNLVGLLLIPLIGAWSDRVNSPLGRRLPFIVVAVPLAALTLAAIPFAAVLLWTLLVTEVAFTAAMHAYRAPIAAIIVDHTPPTRRSTASGIAQLMGGTGVLLSFGGLSLLYDIDRRLTFGSAAAVLLASLGIIWAKADHSPVHIDNAPVASLNPVRDIVDGMRVLLRPPRRVAAGRGARRVAWPLFAVPAVALVADLGGRERIGFYLGIYYVFTMLGQMAGPFVLGSSMDLLGNRGMWVAAAVVSVGSFALLWSGRRRLGTESEALAGAVHRTRPPDAESGAR
jgi:MFS family permease